jgi:sialidase-1
MTEVTVFHEKDGGYFIHRIPALLTTDKGTLLAFCEARIGSVSDAAPTDVVLRRSLDNCKTWPVSRLVFADFSEYSCLAILKDGTIGLLYTKGPVKPTPQNGWYPPVNPEIAFARFNLEWLTHGSDHLSTKTKH